MQIDLRFTYAHLHLRTVMMLHILPLEFDLLFAEEEEEIEMLLENYLQRLFLILISTANSTYHMLVVLFMQ